MDIKDILLILSAEELNGSRLSAAAHLARAQGAQVTGLCLYEPPPGPMSEAFALGAPADGDVLDRIEARTKVHLAPVERDFARAMKGVETVWAEPACESAEATARRARLYDLTIVGAAGVPGGRNLVEHLVLESGGPCLLIPEDRAAATGFDTVVVAWNGSREARRALSDALPLLQHAVHIQIIAAQEAARDLGPAALDGVARRLARHGLTAQTAWLPAHGETAAESIERRVIESRADLLVMGAYSHSHAAEVVLGGVTRYLLGDPPTAILVSR